MKAQGTHLILVLACVWVLWTDVYARKGWRAYGEYETLSTCEGASAETSLMFTKLILTEIDERGKMGFFERLLSSPTYNPSADYKCTPTGVAP